MKNKQGFTLVELLVVIAIIGILSTVAIVNLNSARDKARAASVQSAMSQLTSAAILCHDDLQNLTENGALVAPVVCTGAAGDQPVENTTVCEQDYTDATWPDLPVGWIYEDNCASDYTASTWSFTACEGTLVTCTAGGRTVTCSNTGCTSGITP